MSKVYTAKDHTFVICAYKNSRYIEECIASLNNQTLKTNIILVTSTPSEYLQNISNKYGIQMYVNEGPSGIAEDWNFGLSKVTTKLATIAHQDDIYCEDYAEQVIKNINRYRHPLIAFTDYGELRNSQKVNKNKLLTVKRIMLLPMRIKALSSSVWVRRRILSIGDAISCPTVTYALCNLEQPIFQSGFRCNLDWQAWEKLSKCKGDFVFCKDILMYHRIHAESTTTDLIEDVGRSGEDYEMYKKFWPERIAKLLIKEYKKAEISNKM